jgi:hypothetical protein
MTFAIAHRHADRAVLDVIREVRPPFSPENVVREFSDVLTLYGLTRISGDRYAGEWPREQFFKFGIRTTPRTILPVSSTMQTLVSLTDTSSLQRFPVIVVHSPNV